MSPIRMVPTLSHSEIRTHMLQSAVLMKVHRCKPKNLTFNLVFIQDLTNDAQLHLVDQEAHEASILGSRQNGERFCDHDGAIGCELATSD